MKKTVHLLAMLLAAGMVLSSTSCSSAPEVPMTAESEAHIITELAAPMNETKSPVEDRREAEAPAPTPAPMETEVLSTPAPVPEAPAETTPAPTPVPAPVHTHDWTAVKQTVHHEAVTEERKIIDQPATEGHFEGGTYPVVVCRCGAEFTSAADYYAHSDASGEGHGGFTDSIRSNQVWVEGSPEVSHYETVIVRDAWDEEITTGYVCSSCGAAK